jgi:hypothetical protein
MLVVDADTTTELYAREKHFKIILKAIQSTHTVLKAIAYLRGQQKLK